MHENRTENHEEKKFTVKYMWKVKVTFALEQATNAQRESGCIALLFLQPWR